MEKWKEIPGHPGYQASTCGRIRSIDRMIAFKGKKRAHHKRKFKGRILSASQNNSGYLTTSAESVHRLVALAFIPKPHDATAVNHLDGNKKNNRPENLEWTSHSANTRHAIKTRLIQRSNNGRNILSAEDIRTIRFFHVPPKRGDNRNVSIAKILGKIFCVTRHSIDSIARKRTHSWVE